MIGTAPNARETRGSEKTKPETKPLPGCRGGGLTDGLGFGVLLFNRLSPIFPVDTLAISSGLVTAPRQRRRQAGSEASVLDSDTG